MKAASCAIASRVVEEMAHFLDGPLQRTPEGHGSAEALKKNLDEWLPAKADRLFTESDKAAVVKSGANGRWTEYADGYQLEPVCHALNYLPCT